MAHSGVHPAFVSHFMPAERAQIPPRVLPDSRSGRELNISLKKKEFERRLSRSVVPESSARPVVRSADFLLGKIEKRNFYKIKKKKKVFIGV